MTLDGVETGYFSIELSKLFRIHLTTISIHLNIQIHKSTFENESCYLIFDMTRLIIQNIGSLHVCVEMKIEHVL